MLSRLDKPGKGSGEMGKKRKQRKRALKAAAALAAAQGLPEAHKPAKKLGNTVRRYTQHILVCTDSKSKACKKGGPEVLKAFERAIKARRLGRQIMVTEVGHVGGCGLGPNVIIYPAGVWYGRVTPGDVDEIINEQILAGRPVGRLLRGQRQEAACDGCALANSRQGAVAQAVATLA